MSNIKINLELASPDTKTTEEHLCVRDLKCNYCGGFGSKQKLNEQSQEWEFAPCPVCKGSGRLNADITVAWNPSDITSKQ